ncbi:uncharacterized protein JN550_011652 [Neoarthrinium moseri]|uniref:uncharacterized protein n=1 Tax=Neoarthrinium moseri TaxID=1658444 RepID=UPI001FDBF4D3|nr:uncharacterized protein JN550_011652 [Neoarthrinium moseri]KAI1860274.1 hypothetical protein JN550_011652 [Neoarthrinium moseri]
MSSSGETGSVPSQSATALDEAIGQAPMDQLMSEPAMDNNEVPQPPVTSQTDRENASTDPEFESLKDSTAVNVPQITTDELQEDHQSAGYDRLRETTENAQSDNISEDKSADNLSSEINAATTTSDAHLEDSGTTQPDSTVQETMSSTQHDAEERDAEERDAEERDTEKNDAEEHVRSSSDSQHRGDEPTLEADLARDDSLPIENNETDLSKPSPIQQEGSGQQVNDQEMIPPESIEETQAPEVPEPANEKHQDDPNGPLFESESNAGNEEGTKEEATSEEATNDEAINEEAAQDHGDPSIKMNDDSDIFGSQKGDDNKVQIESPVSGGATDDIEPPKSPQLSVKTIQTETEDAVDSGASEYQFLTHQDETGTEGAQTPKSAEKDKSFTDTYQPDEPSETERLASFNVDKTPEKNVEEDYEDQDALVQMILEPSTSTPQSTNGDDNLEEERHSVAGETTATLPAQQKSKKGRTPLPTATVAEAVSKRASSIRVKMVENNKRKWEDSDWETEQEVFIKKSRIAPSVRGPDGKYPPPVLNAGVVQEKRKRALHDDDLDIGTSVKSRVRKTDAKQTKSKKAMSKQVKPKKETRKKTPAKKGPKAKGKKDTAKASRAAKAGSTAFKSDEFVGDTSSDDEPLAHSRSDKASS